MAVETEAKMAVPEFGPVRAALAALGAGGGGLTLETNVFYDTPDRSLQAAGSGLRVRTNRDAVTGAETHVITHKGPLLAGDVKRREETELTVDSAADAGRLFEQLGFRRTLLFEKRRESWQLDGCKIELDELPHLGKYVEVEGHDEPLVMAVRAKLGLADRPIIKDSYVKLLMTHLKGRAEASQEIRFPAQGGPTPSPSDSDLNPKGSA